MSASDAPGRPRSSAAPGNPFGVRDFRLLWLGEAVSVLGDQFAGIALPWLALVLTGSGLALGGVLALMAIPRAALMLVGGVWVDRISPRRVMLLSNLVRLVAVSSVGVVVLAHAVELWMLYAFALVFGIADAFFYPAQTSIVPELIEADQLPQANALVQGTAQASVLVGPAIAGAVIAAFATDGRGASDTGIAIALLVDGASFIASLATLWLITPRPHRSGAPTPMVEAIREAVRFLMASPGLRTVVLLSLTANLLIVGPFEVGVPVLAYTKLPEGAAAFGVLMSAFGGGSLIGYAAGAMLPAPRPERFAVAVIGAISVAGIGLASLAPMQSTILAAFVTGAAGMALGYGNLLGMSWSQSRVPPQLMGRVMSLLMLGSMGLVPVSELVTGATVQVSLEGTLVVAGLAMAAVSLGSLLLPTVRHVGLEPPYQQSASADAADTDARPAETIAAGAPAGSAD
jgi:MFS family permease